ncbi:hypothetical protein HLB30_08965 [Peptostreptococcus russellii]|uniref:Uncharacterized protein n=1 Tax=Peptostreptococcus russellii TaxID=215200 RepID=A0A1H8GEE3_9FIRM|nr:hypothetical protein [Peptostreptococcus russellii]MBC2578648.1 hypothetical protein [Peptostreptococcus russellii]SEN41678.1 hypothetical protein SAMN05216454_103154 [Peptostreptococcus russellii]
MEIFNFKLIAGVMLFVILISIQITLNKILVTLKEIKRDIRIRNDDFLEDREGSRRRF